MCSARCDGSIYYRLVRFCNLRHVPAPCLLNGVVLACIFPPVSQPFESGLLFFFFVFSFFHDLPFASQMQSVSRQLLKVIPRSFKRSSLPPSLFSFYFSFVLVHKVNSLFFATC